MLASRGKRERKKKKKERKKKCAANQEPKENQKRVCRQLRFKRLLYFIQWEDLRILYFCNHQLMPTLHVVSMSSIVSRHQLCHSDHSFPLDIFSIILPVTGIMRFHCTGFGYLFNFAITEIQICLLHLPHQTTDKPPHMYMFLLFSGREILANGQ